MGDSMTVLVALVAPCVANMVLIWQVATLSDKVDDVQEDMHATARWLARIEAHRLRVAGRRKDGDGDGEDWRRAEKDSQQRHRVRTHVG